MTNKVRILLDRSGSMSSKWESTISAIQEFVTTLSEMPDAELSLFVFDAPGNFSMSVPQPGIWPGPFSPNHPIFPPGQLQNTIPLTITSGKTLPASGSTSLLPQNEDWYTQVFNGLVKDFDTTKISIPSPRGMTALNDALGKFLNTATTEAGDRNMLVIMTDGQENSSKEYKVADIKKVIDSLNKDKFEMVWLGAEFNQVQDQSALYGNISTQNIQAGQYSDTFRGLATTTMAYFKT
jgi:hypothetical protein